MRVRAPSDSVDLGECIVLNWHNGLLLINLFILSQWDFDENLKKVWVLLKTNPEKRYSGWTTVLYMSTMFEHDWHSTSIVLFIRQWMTKHCWSIILQYFICFPVSLLWNWPYFVLSQIMPPHPTVTLKANSSWGFLPIVIERRLGTRQNCLCLQTLMWPRGFSLGVTKEKLYLHQCYPEWLKLGMFRWINPQDFV